jgi:alpha-D-ribose 1-methylphosphonate 5-triphosphate synthase subunit PhnL
MRPRLVLSDVAKSFILHLRGGVELPAVTNVSLSVAAGECVALDGASGSGKSAILKMVYGSYKADRGEIIVAHGDMAVDIAAADPRTILSLRQSTMGYVSQFLRTIPRVSTRDVVAEPLMLSGTEHERAYASAEILLARFNVPRRLWDLPPATFSGGEQQRVNLARGFVGGHPLLLLDEPTASLDADNRSIVASMIAERKAEGTAILGVFHDASIGGAVADRLIDVAKFSNLKSA